MAIDSAEKRLSIRGIGRLWGGPGVTPNASPDAEWRLEVARHYSGIAAFSPDTQFSNFRAEANAPGAVKLKWSYSGSDSIQVWQSTDGTTFTVVATVSSSTTTTTITGLANATLHYFKLSDDLGVTFSSTVTVVTYTAAKLVNQTPQRVRRVSRTHVDPMEFNDLVQQVESRIHNSADSTEPCTVCIFNGALVINCSTQCKNFRVVATENVNSITILGCDPYVCPTIEFIIPPNTTREICGWPTGCEYVGDECFDSPLEGGATGTTAYSTGLTVPGVGAPLGPGSGGPCPCVTTVGLNIQCCEQSNDCILNCESNPSTTLRACGGVQPYTWTKTGGVILSSNTGAIIQVAVIPSTPGSSVDPTTRAWAQLGFIPNAGCFGTPPACTASGSCTEGRTSMASVSGSRGVRQYNCQGEVINQDAFLFPAPYTSYQLTMVGSARHCNGTVTEDSTTGTAGSSQIASLFNGGPSVPTCEAWTGSLTTPFGTLTATASPCNNANLDEFGITTDAVWQSQMFDFRTQAMKDAGCGTSCQGQLAGHPTVTVTDGTGASVTRIMA